MAYIRRKNGFIQAIILVVIALIILGFFGFDVKDIIDSPLVQKNLGYVWGLVKDVWNKFLAEPALYFWHNIFINLFWDTFIDNIQRLKKGKPDDFQENTPTVSAIYLNYA